MELSAHEIEFRQQRLAHLETLKAAGHRPYGRAFERTGSLAEVRAGFAEGQPVRIAGRLVAVREMGKSVPPQPPPPPVALPYEGQRLR